jgi:ectoine hydroxylase-related dioxygenase (phytanoyl-CoA dioxygenase family)
MRAPVSELSAENTDQVVVRVAPGTLLLFPAWLPHSVDANRSAERRISVSFNLMFEAPAQVLARPLWGER